MIDLSILGQYRIQRYGEPRCRFPECSEPFARVAYLFPELMEFLEAADQHEREYHTNG